MSDIHHEFIGSPNFELSHKPEIEGIVSKIIPTLIKLDFGDPTEIAEFLQPSLIWDIDTNTAIIDTIIQHFKVQENTRSNTIVNGLQILRNKLPEVMEHREIRHLENERHAIEKTRPINLDYRLTREQTDTVLGDPSTILNSTPTLNEVLRKRQEAVVILRHAAKTDLNLFFELYQKTIDRKLVTKDMIVEDKQLKDEMRKNIIAMFNLYTAHKEIGILKTVTEIWKKLTTIGLFTDNNLEEWDVIGKNSLNDFLKLLHKP